MRKLSKFDLRKFSRTSATGFTIGLIFLIGVRASAETLSGAMRNNGPDQPLQLVVNEPGQSLNGQVFELTTQGPLDTYLRRLRTGDTLTVQGNVNFGAKKLAIVSIDQVGLQELLGTWQSSTWEIFEFQNFSELNLYVPTEQSEGNVSLSRTHSLKYIVTPDDQGNRFSIFMSDDTDVRMGFIEVGDKKLTLTITDFKTGQVSANISLSPFELH